MGLFKKNNKTNDSNVIDFNEAKNLKENTDAEENIEAKVNVTEEANLSNTDKASEVNQKKEDMIKVYDKYGKEMYITKEQWKKDVLPKQLIGNWNNPNALYSDILNAVSDGFANVVEAAAKRLFEIDTIKERCYVMLSIVYLQIDKIKEAGDVLLEYVKEYGETGIVLTNLAKAYYGLGNEALGYETLTKSLSLDPNQENALDWYCAINYEKDGVSGYVNALNKIAENKGSYRPQMLLAVEKLKNKDIEGARPLIKYVLDNAGDNSDVLSALSGNLGHYGFADEIINIISPLYDIKKHGPMPGMNILMAYLTTQNIEEGEKLLESLFKLNRPDIKPQLMFFGSEFDKLKKKEFNSNGSTPTQQDITGMAFSKPIWYFGLSDPEWLVKTKESGIKVLFLNLAYKTLLNNIAKEVKVEDYLGSLTRSVPLFLSEDLYLTTDIRSTALLPVLKGTGWIVSGGEWPEDLIKEYLGEGSGKFDYVVTGSMNDEGNNYKAMIEIWSKENKSIIKTTWKDAPKDDFSSAVIEIRDILKEFFIEEGAKPCESEFEIKEDYIADYLIQLDQSAVLTCVQSGFMDKEALWGERNIYDSFLDTAINAKDSSVPKIMFLAAMCKACVFGSDIYLEYRDKLYNLIHDETDENSAFLKLSPIFFKMFSEKSEFKKIKNEFINKYGSEYAEWINKL